MAALVLAIKEKHRKERKLEKRKADQRRGSVQAAFRHFAVNGEIEQDGVYSALRELGLQHSKARVDALIQKLGARDGETTGKLDEAQFELLANRLFVKSRRESREVSRQALPWCYRLPTWRGHEWAAQAYHHPKVQATVAAMIIINFMVTIVEKEIDAFPPDLQHNRSTWVTLDRLFTVIFGAELVLNVWSNGGPYKKFWGSGWNVFDFVVVAVGVVFMTGALAPSNPLSNLKMLRAFRVFRLFKRVKSLNKILVALSRSIPGVVNAFAVMVIFMMIYAILAVEYFSPLGQEFGEHPYGTYVTYSNGQAHNISAVTERGYIYGNEYFGTFTRALYTLFQVMTGESWSEVVARPLLFGLHRNAVFVAVYFVSFILLTQIVLTNVVVAVLLDKFIDSPEEKQADEEGRRPSLPLGSPAPSSPCAANGALPAAGAAPPAGSAALEAKLDLLLQAVARCEAGLDEVRREVAGVKGARSSDGGSGARLFSGKAVAPIKV